MKLKTVLAISLVVNVVLLSALGYMMTLNTKVKTPPAFILINKSAPAMPWVDVLVAE